MMSQSKTGPLTQIVINCQKTPNLNVIITIINSENIKNRKIRKLSPFSVLKHEKPCISTLYWLFFFFVLSNLKLQLEEILFSKSTSYLWLVRIIKRKCYSGNLSYRCRNCLCLLICIFLGPFFAKSKNILSPLTKRIVWIAEISLQLILWGIPKLK